MGCDWYNFTSFSGLGFFIDDWDKYEKFMNNDYGCVIFTNKELEDDYGKTEFFIYDKETMTYSNISLPGLYEIPLSNSCTNITRNLNLALLLKTNVENICKIFKISNVAVSYFNIQTTLEIGEFEKHLLQRKAFKSIKEYEKYIGFE